MIARMWETRIGPGMGPAYEGFANTHSRPMFASLPGCLAAIFMGTGDSRTVLSLWTDLASIEALKDSVRYNDTVALFQASDILREPQSIRLVEITGGVVNALALEEGFSAALSD